MFARSLVTRLLTRPTRLFFPPFDFSESDGVDADLIDAAESSLAAVVSLSTAVDICECAVAASSRSSIASSSTATVVGTAISVGDTLGVAAMGGFSDDLLSALTRMRSECSTTVAVMIASVLTKTCVYA